MTVPRPIALMPADTPPITAPADPTTPLEYALAYAALGWHVLPLFTILDGMCSCGDPKCVKNAGKHPLFTLVPHGLHDATTDPDRIRAWWTGAPTANIGIRTGRISGLYALDIDVRANAGGEESWAALCRAHGAPPPTVEAITGSGGRHLLFAYPEAVDELKNTSGKLGAGIDTRGDGGYIVAEPARHRSGGQYFWEASSSPLDGVPLAPLPPWIVRLLHAPKTSAVPTASIPPLPPERVRELRSALTTIPPDERDTWLAVGMALHSEHPGQQGYGLWVEWSQQSEKFDARDQLRTWRAFRPERGITAASLFAMAHEHGWVAPTVEVDASVASFVGELTTPRVPLHVMPGTRDRPEIPAHLLTPPGVLGEVARYGIESAIKPVPVFAVQSALALGSVVCARRYVTSQRNYASCYFLNVARSGTGKEEGKTTIEAILTAAGVRRLVGGSTYSSGNAVYSALLRNPQHIAIIDEFGKYLDAASAAKDSHRSDALTMLMEAFGRVHADMSTPQFSTMTMRANHAAEVEPRIISRPAVTVLALTTPSSFYGALTSTRVLDGFLNRFLVAEHTGARVPMRDWTPVDVPAAVIEWVQQVMASQGDLDMPDRVDHLPPPMVVPLSEGALRRSRAFEREMLTLADRLEPDGLGDMPIRTREIGLRLALIVALSVNAGNPQVTDDVLEWCFQYARYFLHQTVHALRDRMADSDTARYRQTILAAIREAGAAGLSNREFHRHQAIMAIRKADRLASLESLLAGELVAWLELPHDGPGRPRRAIVALTDDATGDVTEAAA